MEKKMLASDNASNYHTVFHLLIPYINDPSDRATVSLVCKTGYELDSITRKDVTIAFCYSTTPRRLSGRFPNLESLKLEGKPRAAMFNLIPPNWGGHAAPWVEEIANSLRQLKAVHFRRMIVDDSDLELLTRTNGMILEVLKLDKCSGFTTDGLLHIGRRCRSLRNLFLEDSTIIENDADWLHELAINNNVLEHLNFYLTDLAKIRFRDLELIAKNCTSLVSVKISDGDLLNLVGFFKAALTLQEFYGVSIDEVGGQAVLFPPRLCRLGITYLQKSQMSIILDITSRLQKLDLLYALLDTEGHCHLLQTCPHLEILETRDVIGDKGLQVLAQFCKRLKRLRIERGADDPELEDKEGIVTQRGLIALSQGCLDQEYLAVYVSDVTNYSLDCIGKNLKLLLDFRLVLLDRYEQMADLPLDIGVQSLLRGCYNLRRFALYLRPVGLTDKGLGYIGKYSLNIRWMLLGFFGESDEGLIEFSRGCRILQKLEIRGCCFSEYALSMAALQLTSLRYLWVQGYRESADGRDILAMARPFWNMESVPAMRVLANEGDGEEVVVEHASHILAYYSLDGQRVDFPNYVVPVPPAALAL